MPRPPWTAGLEPVRSHGLDLGPPRPGEVVLVGAGPGHPGLLTVAGREALQAAEVVVHDRLVPKELLAWVEDDCRRIDVGKRPAGPSTRQEEIHRILVREARRGRRVVRLKGGDPFLFGRGGEELEALQTSGVAARWIPGVSSALAAPAAAGIPVTHRGVSARLTVATGHRCQAASPGSEAAEEETLVVLMGVGSLAAIEQQLISGGRSPDTPAALVERATWPDQRVLRTTLGELAIAARHAEIQPPAVLVVGEVVNVLSSPATRVPLLPAFHATRHRWQSRQRSVS